MQKFFYTLPHHQSTLNSWDGDVSCTTQDITSIVKLQLTPDHASESRNTVCQLKDIKWQCKAQKRYSSTKDSLIIISQQHCVKMQTAELLELFHQRLLYSRMRFRRPPGYHYISSFQLPESLPVLSNRCSVLYFGAEDDVAVEHIPAAQSHHVRVCSACSVCNS